MEGCSSVRGMGKKKKMERKKKKKKPTEPLKTVPEAEQKMMLLRRIKYN